MKTWGALWKEEHLFKKFLQSTKPNKLMQMLHARSQHHSLCSHTHTPETNCQCIFLNVWFCVCAYVRDGGPLWPHWEGVTLLPNIQALLPMTHNRVWGWRGWGHRQKEPSLVKSTVNTWQKSRKTESRDLEEGENGGRGQSKKGDLMKNIYVASATDRKSFLPPGSALPVYVWLIQTT